MRAELINFELWHTKDIKYDEDTLNRDRVNLILTDIKKFIKEQRIDTVIGLLLIDGFLYSSKFYEALEFIETESKKLGIINFYLLPGMCGLSQYQDEIDKRNLSYKVITGYDFAAQQVFLSYKNSLETKWNPNAKKFLFLGGVPNRANRIGLLSRYYDSDMLKDAEWSFFPPWTKEDKRWCRNYLSKYNDSEYENFLFKCTRKIDHKYDESKKYSTASSKELVEEDILNTSWIKDPSYIDPAVYQQTCLSIISKYEYDDSTCHSFLGEKTWRAIINKHPFIIADNKPAERFDYMISLGLNTFNEYVIKDYGYILDEDERLSAVVDSTKLFLNNIKKHKNNINDAIENNYNIFVNIIKKNNQIENFIKDMNVSLQSIDYWFTAKGYDRFIRIPT